ncbi:hypothetical protein [Blastococcus sp. SYSU DS0828]
MAILGGSAFGLASSEILALAVGAIGLIAAFVYALISRPPLGASRSDRIGSVVLAGFLGAFLFLSIDRLYSGASEAAAYLSGTLGGMALSYGVLTEWRTRRFGQALHWTLPIVLSLLGGTTLALGVLGYRLFEEALGVPAGALSYETFDYVITGSVPVIVGVAVLFVGVGFIGLLRRYAGIGTMGGGFVPTLVVASFFAMATAASLAPTVAAELRVDGPTGSYFPFYGVRVDASCVRFLAEDGYAVEGGEMDVGQPWILLGEKDSRYLLWDSRRGYRRVLVDQVSLTIVPDDESRCPA